MSTTIKLRDYQKAALQSWIDNNYQGLFAMATGTGKTLTSLSCARYIKELKGKVHLFILVPTLDLAKQWKTETKAVLSINSVLANSENNNWYSQSLALLNSIDISYCIITTYATFLTGRFQEIIRNTSSNAMLIADEAHNFGTKRHIELYPENILLRLGLSATPERYYDEDGSQSLFKYFKADKGFTFEFGMKQAIDENFLCEYYYYPILVKLTEDELDAYKVISKKLLKFFNSKTGTFKEGATTTSLLLKRKRIIHQAIAKKDALRNILSELKINYKPLKFLLVYVPEGNDGTVELEDTKLINSYSQIISNEFFLKQHQFIGGTKNRENILNDFTNGKLDVLTAMKCLDEGVDIKRAEIAIFCSSTGNPRQFVQRRGRILRTHPQKKYAVIYDMIVVPTINIQYFGDGLSMEKSILQSELRRVHEFAGLSLNHYQALDNLEAVAKEFNLDIYEKKTIN